MSSIKNSQPPYDKKENTKKLLRIFKLNPSYFIQSEIILTLVELTNNQNLFNDIDVNNFKNFCEFADEVLSKDLNKDLRKDLVKETGSEIIKKSSQKIKNKKLEERLKELLSKQLFNKLELGTVGIQTQELTLDQEFAIEEPVDDLDDDDETTVSESNSEESEKSEESEVSFQLEEEPEIEDNFEEPDDSDGEFSD